MLATAATVGPAGAPLGGFAAPASAVLVVAGAGLVWSRLIRVRIVPLIALLCAVSLVVTAAHLPYGDGGAYASGWTLVETAGLLALVVVVVRRARPVTALLTSLLAAFTVAVSLLRTLPPTLSAGTVAMCLFWASLAGAAAVAGGYLRALDARRARSVEHARRVQRLELAADLHDFVAHEVSGMLFQAQAARLVSVHDLDRTREALDRIERAGQRALSTLDRTVHMLRDDEATPRHDWADIRSLARRYAAAGPTTVDVRLDPSIDGDAAEWRDELAGLAYRIVVEALTNVRRHAPSATAVSVELDHLPEHSPSALRLRVTDDGSPADGQDATQATDRAPGSGLAWLAWRVDDVGGTFTAGPDGPAGWQVTAVLPTRDAAG